MVKDPNFILPSRTRKGCIDILSHHRFTSLPQSLLHMLGLSALLLIKGEIYFTVEMCPVFIWTCYQLGTSGRGVYPEGMAAAAPTAKATCPFGPSPLLCCSGGIRVPLASRCLFG